jgi:ketosteroid isomerase-like protein
LPEDAEQIDSRQEQGTEMSGSRKDVLSSALKAEVGAASVDLETLFTDDVVGWSPYVALSGLAALAELAALREAAFSNVVITFRGLDEVGNKAFAEWLVEADHTGPLVLSEDAVLEATGRHVQLPGVTVADFRDGKIRSFRTYFDDLSLIEQIVGA